MYKYALIVEAMIVIYPGLLNDIQPYIMNDMGNFFQLFLNIKIHSKLQNMLVAL